MSIWNLITGRTVPESLDDGARLREELGGYDVGKENMAELLASGVSSLFGGGVPVTVTVALDNGYLVVFVPKKHRANGPDIDDLTGVGQFVPPSQLQPMRGRQMGQPQMAPPPPPSRQEIEERNRKLAERWKEERTKSIAHEPRVRVYPTLSLAMIDIESFMKNGVPPNVTISDGDLGDLGSGGTYAVMA